MPDGDDVAGVADADLDVRFFINPTPSPRSLPALGWHVHGPTRLNLEVLRRVGTVIGIQNGTIEVLMLVAVLRNLDSAFFPPLNCIVMKPSEQSHVFGIEKV